MSIRLEHLNYIYSPNTAYEKHALKDICLEIPDGEFVGISAIPVRANLRLYSILTG